MQDDAATDVVSDAELVTRFARDADETALETSVTGLPSFLKSRRRVLLTRLRVR